MKSKMFKKLMAAALATTMIASLAACDGKTPADGSSESSSSQGGGEVKPSDDGQSSTDTEVSKYTILKDENGNVYDLGGMEIVIRDWWTAWPPTDDDVAKTEYDEAKEEYLDWIQTTYNFKIHQEKLDEWGDTPQKFVDYASAPDDGANYVWVLRRDPAVMSAMASGLMKDLSKLSCLDFSAKKFQLNKTHELFKYGDAIYAMYGDYSEPRTGMYFNERLLKEAGIDPEEIYDLQKNGQWTFDKFEELCKKVRQDKNNDGVYEVYAFGCNNGVMTEQAVYSNGGEFVGKDASGKFVYKVDDPKTVEGLNWARDMFTEYRLQDPEGAEWDYYKNAFLNGEFVFLPDQAYLMNNDLKPAYDADGNLTNPGMTDPVGFVMFPKGPQMSDYTNCWDNNLMCIPGNYSDEKAWKIAFAWNLYTDANVALPGFEDYKAWKNQYANGVVSDLRAINETLDMMTTKGMVTYHGLIPTIDMGPWLTWQVFPNCPPISETIEAHRAEFMTAIDEANK